jgi:DNA-binding transcriptional regulator YiaG
MNAKDLKAWRKTLNLSAAEAARRLECSRTSIQSWERGKTSIPGHVGYACTAIAMGLPKWRWQK